MKFTEREKEVLDRLLFTEWLRPMDVGGRSGSHHSATLARLHRKNIIARKDRCGLACIRKSYVYKLVEV